MSRVLKTPGKTKLVQHPKLPFVYIYGKKQICIEHPNPPGMNKGSMRQHVEGKAHKRNYDTGELIANSEFPKEILAQLDLKKQESKVEPKQDIFYGLKNKLEFMFPNNPKDVKDLLARHGFEDSIKYDIQNTLDSHKKDKQKETLIKYLDALKDQKPEMFLELFKSVLLASKKKDEKMNALPSKTVNFVPITIPKPAKMVHSNNIEIGKTDIRQDHQAGSS